MNSNLRRLLETNIAPTQEEAKLIQLSLSREVEEITSLETQITQLQTTLNLLILEREDRRARIRAKQGVLSAIRRIPPEIVAQIFIRCLRTDDDEYKDDLPPFPNVGPLVLTRICSGWKQVALNLPQLWSKLSINFDYIPLMFRPRPAQTSYPRLADLARFWISRASTVPLTVRFRCRQVADFNSEIAHTVMNPANRLGDITLECSEQLMLACLSSMVGALGDLEAVNLRGLGDFLPQQWTRAPPIFNSSPKLQRFSIRNITPSIFGNILTTMPWGQLTELTINLARPLDHYGPMTPLTCYKILRQCLNLVTFCVSMDEEPSNVMQVHTPVITLEHMRKLDVRFIPTNRSIDSFYQLLVLPALKDLRLKRHGIETFNFAALLSRSSFVLETLEFWPEQDPTEILALVPSLTELRLSMPFFTGRLSQGIFSHELLPNLQMIKVLEIWTTPSIPVFGAISEAIFVILKSRWWPGSIACKLFNRTMVSRLKRVCFHRRILDNCPSDVPQHLLGLLEQCQREGLKLVNPPFLDDDDDDEKDEHDSDDD